MLALLTVCAALTVSAAELDLKERPVTKIVKLLEKMQQELEKEKQDDQDLQDRLVCWCQTTGSDKAAAIEIANKRIEGLSSDIQAMMAKSSELEAAIKQLNKEIDENDQALRKADELRQKELAEFNTGEKELLQSIQALGNAVTVLSKHHESFLQVGSSSLSNLASVLKVTRTRAQKFLAPAQMAQLDSFLSQPAGYQSYASQSGTIFGVLKQMKETFEKDLNDSQAGESQAASDFAALKKAKTEEMRAATAQVKAKSEDLAQTNEALAAANADAKLTGDALAADTKFLADLKERCARTDADFEERSQTRQDEIVAVGQTIQILTSDEAHDLFGKSLGSVKPAFLQTSARTHRLGKTNDRMRRAAKVLDAAGLSGLAQLASSVQLDAFTKVQKAIDDMVAELTVQQKDQVDHRDWCIKELDETKTNRAVKQDEIDDLTAFIEDSKAKIDDLTKDLAELNKQNSEMKTAMKRASDDRESENAEFQQFIAEQRGTQYILNKAMERMKAFYEEKAPELKDQLGNPVEAVQVDPAQEPGAAAAPPPSGFNEFKKNKGGGGVVGLLQGLINESKAMENDGLKAENDSQEAYENFTKDNNNSIKKNNECITMKTGEKAQTDAAKIQAESDRKAAMGDMEKLMAYDATLHGSCDFTLKNFEKIQEARANEIEALRQAKAILSGADFS